MRNLFVIFCFFFVLLVSCSSNNNLTAQPENSDIEKTGSGTIQVENAGTTEPEYPEPYKLCAITFDDGPDVIKTTLVLDKLEYHEVVGTFFLVGQLINANTESILDRMISMGCEVGNHSFGWKSMDAMDSADIGESVRKTSDSVEKYTGVRPDFFRPPNLAVNNTMFEAVDLPFVSGVLGYDWLGGKGNTAQKVAKLVLNDPNMRDGAIILLHDVQPDPHPTPEALDILIPELKILGYEFVTLSELFDRKGVNPNVEDKMWVVAE